MAFIAATSAGVPRRLLVDNDGNVLVTTKDALTLRMVEGATYTYIGKAAPGSSTASAVWQVMRITNADTTILLADGNDNFDNVWDNYASLSYS